jgi:hypothetical protein
VYEIVMAVVILDFKDYIRLGIDKFHVMVH